MTNTPDRTPPADGPRNPPSQPSGIPLRTPPADHAEWDAAIRLDLLLSINPPPSSRTLKKGQSNE